ncbi:MAG: helix-turn-helix transcriptional regulator [Anaerolineae bacterium]
MKPVTSKGKHNTRETILHALKTTNQAKVEDLAKVANVSPVTVRHHLNAMQADGLIEVSSVRRKVGRPYYVYSLSEAGHELFPRKYIRLTGRLLDELKQRMPEAGVSDLFHSIVQNILKEYKDQLTPMPFEDRLAFLVDLLAEEGFLAHWNKVDGQYQLVEYSCPYYSLAHEHGEICILDKQLIVDVLQTPIQQHSCMVAGDGTCSFTFLPDTIATTDNE